MPRSHRKKSTLLFSRYIHLQTLSRSFNSKFIMVSAHIEFNNFEICNVIYEMHMSQNNFNQKTSRSINTLIV